MKLTLVITIMLAVTIAQFKVVKTLWRAGSEWPGR